MIASDKLENKTPEQIIVEVENYLDDSGLNNPGNYATVIYRAAEYLFQRHEDDLPMSDYLLDSKFKMVLNFGEDTIVIFVNEQERSNIYLASRIRYNHVIGFTWERVNK